MGDGLRLALTTLTVARVRGPARLDRATAGRAMVLAPLVGLLLGLVATGVLLGAAEVTGDLLASVLAIAALAALTRGLHLDGLSDTADGLGSYAPPERAREIMKQPDVGALGLAAVLLVVLVQVGALLACLQAGRGGLALVLAATTGRLAVTAACTPATRAAAAGGLGALVAGTVPRGVPLALGALLTAVAGAHAGLDGRALDALRVLVAVLVGLAAAEVLRRHAVRRLGGITGDVLGALVEVTTAVVLVAMSVSAP